MYRIKQFIWAFLSNFKECDEEFLKRFLNKDEMNLFLKLSRGEQFHCIRVCKTALIKVKDIDIDKIKLSKAALLHDIGKIYCKLNIFEKSIIVILDKITKSKISKYTNNKKIDIYYNHPIKGYRLLKSYKLYEEDFLEVMKYHHLNNSYNKNIYLKIISESDNEN